MHISKDRWLQLKQELPTLIFFFVLQLWFSLSYPPFQQAGYIVNYISAGIVTLLVTCAYAYAFLFPETYINLMNLTFFDEYPDPAFVKRIFKIYLFVFMHILYAFLWYKNLYGRPHSWYILCYGLFMITIVLICSALRRIEKSMNPIVKRE